jgi:hypothetical protein
MDFTTRFYFLFYEAWLGFLYRVRQELEKFADGLATWIQALTAQTMPENWRDYLADELADWEDKGIIVQPHGLPVLEKWILAKAKRRGTLPLGYRASEPGMVADRFADLARVYPSSVAVADTEMAGFDRDSRVVFQETSPEFRAKVQRALELLDPEVAAWWQSPGVNGLVRSYDQDDFPGSSPHHSFCLVENGQAIVVVDRRFTAGRTAQGIIYLAHSGLFLFPKDANFNFRPSFSPISAAVKDLRFGRDPAVLESAKSISIVAEMSVKRSTALGSGSSSEDGTLAVTAKDIGDLTWRDLLRALAAYRLPPDVRALEIILPGRGSGPVRTIFLSADLLRAFLQFPLADRQTIMAAASSVRPDEAQAAIVRAVAVAERETNGIGPVGRQELPPGMTAAALAEAIAEAQRQARWFECFGTPLASKLLSHFAEGTGTDYVLTGSDLGRVLVSSKFGEMKDAVTARFKGRLAGAHLTGKDEPFTWDGGQQVVRYDKPGSRLDRSWDADMF